MKLLDRRFDVRTDALAPVQLGAQELRAVEQFIYQEARLLDERRFEEWLGLWTAEGRYWVPRHHGQANPFEQVSLFWEDAMLRETRVRRITNARNWSQQPVTRTVHTVGSVQVDGLDAAGHLVVASSVHIDEFRLEPRHLGARVVHKLARQADGAWRIQLKRIDLANADAVFNNLEVFL